MDGAVTSVPDPPRTWEYVFTFGKHDGRTLERVLRCDHRYIDWLAQADIFKEPRRLRERPQLQRASELAGVLVPKPDTGPHGAEQLEVDEASLRGKPYLNEEGALCHL